MILCIQEIEPCICICERVDAVWKGAPPRLIEFYRRENRLLERMKHKMLLLCYNKPVSGRQTTQSLTHTHTELSTVRAIGVCVCVLV